MIALEGFVMNQLLFDSNIQRVSLSQDFIKCSCGELTALSVVCQKCKNITSALMIAGEDLVSSITLSVAGLYGLQTQSLSPVCFPEIELEMNHLLILNFLNGFISHSRGRHLCKLNKIPIHPTFKAAEQSETTV